MSGNGDEDEATAHSAVRRPRQLGDLLIHLPEYGLVICKSCEFAIQPKAIPSHLLRHKVYRNKRQNLLDRVAEMRLLAPDAIKLPVEKIPAIPHLPISEGYRCRLPICGHLCISQKRMTQHLREQHAHVNAVNVDDHAQSVYIQTFFKGNKVRYFEVEPAKGKLSANSTRRPDDYRFINASKPDQELRPGLPIPISDSTPSRGTTGTQLQMESLMYLHHYITVTALSLTRGPELASFWTRELPLHAEKQPFLMHGILGAAAFHQAVLELRQDESQRHRSAGLHHQAAGLATFRGIVDLPTQETSTAVTTFARLLGVQICAQALLEARDHSSHANGVDESEISEVLECMQLLRGGLELLLRMQKFLPPDSGLLLPDQVLDGLQDLEFAPEVLNGSAPYVANEMFSRLASPEAYSLHLKETFRLNTLTDVRQFMRLCNAVSETTPATSITESWIATAVPGIFQSSKDLQTLTNLLRQSQTAGQDMYRQTRGRDHPDPCPPLMCYPNIPPKIYENLLSLPSRLVARVDEVPWADIKAFDQAMAALISSFSRCYASDEVWARWNGIESWPRMLPDPFVNMIRNLEPLALVLVAHWLYFLSMQEKHYWFLLGRSRRMLRTILRNLNPDLQTFVQDCISSLDATR